LALPFVRSFALAGVTGLYGLSSKPHRVTAALLRPLLTSRSAALRRRPFRRKARSPRVRTLSFVARPSDLRRLSLATRASRSLARSPWTAPPRIRFLFVGPRLRSPLPPHGRSPFPSCVSLRLLWPAHERTFTTKTAPTPGAPNRAVEERHASSPAAPDGSEGTGMSCCPAPSRLERVRERTSLASSDLTLPLSAA